MRSASFMSRAGWLMLGTTLALLLLAWSGMLERTDRWWYDSLQRFGSHRADLPTNTAIVLIDEQTLEALGEAPFAMRWPWPRTAFAALLAGLSAAGAEHIVVDLIFFEKSPAAEQDALLGAVAAGLTGVSLGATEQRLPVVWPDDFRNKYPHLFSAQARWGIVDSQPDADAIVRAYSPTGSLAASALTEHQFAGSETVLVRWRGNLEQLRERGVPMVPAAPFVIAGWDILKHAAASSPDLEPQALAAAIRFAPPPSGEVFAAVQGKTVFVGANAAATFDAVATPLGAPEPGVVVHWNAFASLEAGDFILGFHPLLGGLLAVAIVLLLLRFGSRFKTLQSLLLVTSAAALGVVAGSASLFFAGWWFAPGLPLTACAVGLTTEVMEMFRQERLRRQEIQGWFGAYVSPAVVERLVADPSAIELGGEQRELTIMFSDIAGFTTISESLSPPDLVALINRFLEDQTERIIDHGGYLDKYIGDAIMAVFGSPEELDNHALAACRAALACREVLEELNDELEPKTGFRISMRTGINTGDVVVGNVGSTRKRNYTVLGDAVNLASRLEGANKQTGTLIMLGPVTAEYVSGEMLLRPTALLQVKGKTRAVQVFELLSQRKNAQPEALDFAATFTQAFEAYCQQDFIEAGNSFKRAAQQRPDDMLSSYYLQECNTLAQTPPPPGWQAILKLETK